MTLKKTVWIDRCVKGSGVFNVHICVHAGEFYDANALHINSRGHESFIRALSECRTILKEIEAQVVNQKLADTKPEDYRIHP